ncbi:MAG TPA: cobyric acid synthase, partial [Egibacteraceae bacterium]|nr:cobyric acid synthase [Egibacteraceae bacterium]
SVVTVDGGEIGRAQAMQAAAARVEPEVAMNPVLLKPSGERTSQVIVMGRAIAQEDARSYQRRKAGLAEVCRGALDDLRGRFDVVICEGAGSPTEINLRVNDLANMGLARAADLPVIVVGDIDRGGVFATLHGTLALLEPADQALIAAFVINKFRGDRAILDPGLRQLRELTGRPVLGVLPYTPGLGLDGEDSMALERGMGTAGPPLGADGLIVAVVRTPRIANFTDVDPLTCEPGVSVRFTDQAAEVAAADLAVVLGSKATVEDLGFLRSQGIDRALALRARRGQPVLGVCAGYQMLGGVILDEVESGAGRVEGLGLLPVRTRFAADKQLRRRRGSSPAFGDAEAAGYEIRHGRVESDGAPLLVAEDGEPDGCVHGAVLGTSWHGLLESDGFRRALLEWAAQRQGLDFFPGAISYAALRDAQLDVLGDLVSEHLDTAAVAQLIECGAPSGLAAVGR